MTQGEDPLATTSSHAPRRAAGLSFRVRLAIFVATTLAVVGAEAWLVRPQIAELAADLTVSMTMSGFEPGRLEVPANRPTTVRLVNADSQFHPGGAVHQFVAPALGIDVLVEPKASKVITLPALPAGTYEFYCDVCCGGKESAGMRGTIVVG